MPYGPKMLFTFRFGDPETSALLQVVFLVPVFIHIPPYSTKLKALKRDFAATEGKNLNACYTFVYINATWKRVISDKVDDFSARFNSK